MRNAQEIFDHVANHLLTQNARAARSTGSCVMLDPETGRRCAVGSLVPADALPAHILNAYSSPATLAEESRLPLALREELKHHAELLSCLQGIHDGMLPESWRDALANFAKRSNLEFHHA